MHCSFCLCLRYYLRKVIKNDIVYKLRNCFSGVEDTMSNTKELKKQYRANRDQIRRRRKNLREEQKNLRQKYHLDRSLAKQNPQEDFVTDEDYLAYSDKISHSRNEEISWEKLDNSALMYPIITGEDMSNVYRMSATLKEEINPELLQRALDVVLPKFPGFNSRLRQGMHWYYLEENGKPAPLVKKEDEFPCAYIDASRNRSYLFRVTYFRCRINLEVFHVLSDGTGALYFLKEIVYQYLRYLHPELQIKYGNDLTEGTTVSAKDMFQEFYDKKPLRPYRFQRAFLIPGSILSGERVGIIHGYLKVDEVREMAHSYQATINELIVSVLVYSIWQEYAKLITPERPIVICVPVNLRPVFGVDTTKNFFVNINAVFRPEKAEEITFAEVIRQIKQSLREQTTREELQNRLSTNVSTETNLLSRMVPMIFKNPVLKQIHKLSQKSITSTVTNIGLQTVAKPYQEYVDFINVVLAHAKGQPLKLSVSSYGDTIAVNVTSILRSTNIPQNIYRFFTEHDMEVKISTNGVYR